LVLGFPKSVQFFFGRVWFSGLIPREVGGKRLQ